MAVSRRSLTRVQVRLRTLLAVNCLTQGEAEIVGGRIATLLTDHGGQRP